MTETQLAEWSRVLFAPVTMLLYLAAMGLYLYALAFTRVDRGSDEPAIAGTRALKLATAVAVLGLGTHLAHLVTRSLAAGGRVPWGTMFEYSSVTGFIVVLAGVVVFQWRMRKPEVVGFLLLGSLLTMGGALLLYAEPGPLQPILNSQWLKIHVFTIMLAAAIFTVGFVFNGLHLIRDTAERRVAERQTETFSGSTVGAAYAGEVAGPTRAPGMPGDDDAAYTAALRSAISPWRLAAGTFVGAAAISWVFIPASDSVAAGVQRFVSINLAIALAAVVGWWFVGKLPAAATLDSLAYRTIVFAFPIWTFAVLAGAVWAEQSWGRYWGWDPKETSAFLTWVAYAGYLHARATRGVRGRGAAWLGIAAFAVLMFTYYAVNLVVTGLHSYGGLPN